VDYLRGHGLQIRAIHTRTILYIRAIGLILETVKELLYQERLKDSVRLLGISLSNLNTEEKKTVVVQLKFAF
jgi:DNA polymerase-4